MEWQAMLLTIFAGLVGLMATGMPIALCFMLINLVGMYIFFGGTAGLEQLILSIFSSLATFELLPVPMFILMGEVMFHSGIALIVLDILDKWLGRLPGRLGLLAVAAGVLLASLTGSSIASTGILGSVLVPDMEKRGYKKPMSLGPIMGAGGLAIMIPPSAMAVLLGTIGEISVGKILISIIVPGLLMAFLYALYIILRCALQPFLAPVYELTSTPLSKKVADTVRYVLPLGIVIFLVIGVILLGIATPSEAAATGTAGIFLVIAAYGLLKWEVVKKSVYGTLRVTGMIYLIVAGAAAFGQILSYSGASQGLAEFATHLPLPPILIVVLMHVIVLIMGCFMSVIAIMMVTLPIFVPLVVTLGFDPVWFAAVYLINVEMAALTPPFGLNLYVMKGVAPPGTTMGEIIGAAMPFLVCNFVAMGLIIAFPPLALWLPQVAK
jgi:tripartite ATP-independent transporter DctM subunit